MAFSFQIYVLIYLLLLGLLSWRLVLSKNLALSSDPLVPFVPPDRDSVINMFFASESDSRPSYRKESIRPSYSDRHDSEKKSSSFVQNLNDAYWPDATPAAVHTTQHAVGLKEVDNDSAPISPQTVIVDATVMPLTIYFRSTSSLIKVIQEHLETKGDIQHSQSEEEPHRLYHEVHKPIIQEVHEVIKPYRRIIQEMHPVYEDVKTIISRASDDASSHKPNYEKGKFSVPNQFDFEDLESTAKQEDLYRIITGDQQELSLKEKVNLTVALKAPSFDPITTGALNDNEENRDRANVREERAFLNGTTTTSTTTTTTTTTVAPSISRPNINSLKRKRHPVAAKQHVKTFKSTEPALSFKHNFNRTRRLAIKRLVNKIDRQKRKIRLGFFGLYGINVIPYIYDQYQFDVKIRVPVLPNTAGSVQE